jgi:cytochrome c oxidase subunit IV
MSTTGHPPIASIRLYVSVWLALIVLTGLTTWVAFFDLGFLNNVVALGIAVLKASLVVLFFMGVRHNTPLTKVVVVAGVLWLMILFTLGMSDYLTRSWLGIPGR